jgi:uncharacterized protein (DUF433 family)
MMRIDWHKHISVDPEIHHGEPCVTGTRIPVSMIVGSIAKSMSVDEIVNQYPQLDEESIQAALAYESDRVWEKLMKIKDELGKNWQSEKSAVEILSEMRR